MVEGLALQAPADGMGASPRVAGSGNSAELDPWVPSVSELKGAESPVVFRVSSPTCPPRTTDIMLEVVRAGSGGSLLSVVLPEDHIKDHIIQRLFGRCI